MIISNLPAQSRLRSTMSIPSPPSYPDYLSSPSSSPTVACPVFHPLSPLPALNMTRFFPLPPNPPSLLPKKTRSNPYQPFRPMPFSLSLRGQHVPAFSCRPLLLDDQSALSHRNNLASTGFLRPLWLLISFSEPCIDSEPAALMTTLQYQSTTSGPSSDLAALDGK
jgi:hypothetical protein